MKSYYRVMLGRKSIYAPECLAGKFVGAGFDINQDLTSSSPTNGECSIRNSFRSI